MYLIDTGCCDGKALTGLLLPEFRLVSAPAQRNHWGIALQGHPEFKGQRERT